MRILSQLQSKIRNSFRIVKTHYIAGVLAKKLLSVEENEIFLIFCHLQIIATSLVDAHHYRHKTP